MAIKQYLPRNAEHPGNLRHVRLFGQFEPGNRWLEIQVDGSGRLQTVIGPGDEAIGAVELKDHNSALRADIGPQLQPFGNALHALCYVDPTGRARAASVDAQGRVLLSNVDIQIGAVELKNFDTDMRAEISMPGATFAPALHAMVFQDATGGAQPALVDESGRVMLSEIDIQIGAVELKDHDSGLRSSITDEGAAFGPALHVLPAVDVTGQARPLSVDHSGWIDARVRQSSLPEGAATEATLVQARDSLDVIDDWDQNDRAKTSPIPGQDGVAADSGASDVLTQRVIAATDSPDVTALEIIDDWDATHDEAYADDGPQILGAYDAVAPSVGNGDAVRFALNAFGRLIGASDNIALGARAVVEQAPVPYDFLPGTARASAALGAAYDAAPEENPTGSRAWVLYAIGYVRGAAGGSISVKIERGLTIGGTDIWPQTSIIASGVVVPGADTTSPMQEEEFDFQSTGAAIDYFCFAVRTYRCSKLRISARESSGLAVGTAVVYQWLSN